MLPLRYWLPSFKDPSTFAKYKPLSFINTFRPGVKPYPNDLKSAETLNPLVVDPKAGNV